MTDKNDWKQWITDTLGKVLGKIPLDGITKEVKKWFSVSEEDVKEILQQVRENLPTTEALLIGKTQTGKSSIVRGLTGVGEEIIGSGFKPHTQHTERYVYPTEDLPLIIFTDTVGLGDVSQDTEGIIGELLGDLATESKGARIIILTVKVNDFAIASLHQIISKIKEKYPQIPCLLAITCLHELYPANIDNHPEYPPSYPELERAVKEILAGFTGLYSSYVLLDFTLEEDGFTPVFYGKEFLGESLQNLLPSAESQAIYQLLSGKSGDKIGNLYRDVARRYILAFTIIVGGAAALPLPFATMPVLTTLQVSMVTLLGKLYGQVLTPSQAGGIVSTIAGGFLAQAIARELLKFIPVFGSAISASWAVAYTWALGEAACVYFGDLMGGKKPDPVKIQEVMAAAFQEKLNKGSE